MIEFKTKISELKSRKRVVPHTTNEAFNKVLPFKPVDNKYYDCNEHVEYIKM